MAYDESQNTDQGWSKPRLKQKSSKAGASRAAAKDGPNGAKEPGSYTSGLKAKIKARREQEQVKGVSQGIKARSKAFNQKQQEQAAQEEVGSEAISKKRPSGKKKFKSNKLFGLTLLAPGLDECDPEGVAALDGTLAAYLGQAPAQPDPSCESCNARRPAADEMEPLPMAAPMAAAPANAPQAAAPVDVAPIAESAAAASAAVEPVAASSDPAFGGAPEVALPEAGQMRPYIPGRRPAAEPAPVAELPPASVAASSSVAAKLQLAPTSPLRPYKEPLREEAVERKPYIPGLRLNAPTDSQPSAEQPLAAPVSSGRPPVSPLRPYQTQPGSAATERQPYIPGRRPAASAGGQAIAPNFGSSTGSVYRAPVSAAPVAASATKNTVLPLPVGRNHKSEAKKDASHEEGGSSYRSSARANSGADFGSPKELGGADPDMQNKNVPLEDEEEELQTEGKSLLELLESVPVAKKNRIGRYI